MDIDFDSLFLTCFNTITLPNSSEFQRSYYNTTIVTIFERSLQ